MILFGSMMSMGKLILPPSPAFVAGRAPDSGGATFTDYPAGAAVGDTVFVVVGGIGTAVDPAPASISGWNSTGLGALTGGGDYGEFVVYRHTITGAFGSSKNFALTGTSVVNAAYMMAFRNVVSFGSAISSLGSADFMPSSPTLLGADTMKAYTSLHFGGIARTNTGSNPSPTAPSGYTLIGSNHQTDGAKSVCVMAAYNLESNDRGAIVNISGMDFGGTPYGASGNHGNRGAHYGLVSS